VKERIRALEAFAYSEASRGVTLPGFKLVEKRPSRKWKNQGDVIEWAEKAAIDPYAPRELLSVAQLETKVAEGAPRGKKKEAKAVLAEFIESISSGTTLVTEDDARPAVKVLGSNDFAVLDAPAQPAESSVSLFD
jgi:hypothetical protein